MQGKSKNKIDSAYYIDTPEQLKQMYMEHMNSLAISDEYRFKTELETVKMENEKMKEREEKLNDILKRLEKLENG